MFAGLLWKPWLRGHFVSKRRRVNRRAGLVHRVIVGGFALLSSQSKLGLYSSSSTPLVNVLLKWSRSLWFGQRKTYGRLVSLVGFCVIQSILGFNAELEKHLNVYLHSITLSRTPLGVSLLPQRKKRFFFVNQQPKRFVLWLWSISLLQSNHTAPIMSRPLRVLRVLTPASFLLPRKKLKRFKKKR
jgi:hypothetical protein